MRLEDTDQKIPPGILLAEDDDEMRSLLAWALRKHGFEITECSDGLSLLNHLDSFFSGEHPEGIDLIISDVRMPGFTGLEILEGLTDFGIVPPMILITAFGDEETHAIAERLGAVAMLDKPFDLEDLLSIVDDIMFTRTPQGIRRSLSYFDRNKKHGRQPRSLRRRENDVFTRTGGASDQV